MKILLKKQENTVLTSNNRPSDSISFMTVVTGTSVRRHCDLVVMLFFWRHIEKPWRDRSREERSPTVIRGDGHRIWSLTDLTTTDSGTDSFLFPGFGGVPREDGHRIRTLTDLATTDMCVFISVEGGNTSPPWFGESSDFTTTDMWVVRLLFGSSREGTLPLSDSGRRTPDLDDVGFDHHLRGFSMSLQKKNVTTRSQWRRTEVPVTTDMKKIQSEGRLLYSVLYPLIFSGSSSFTDFSMSEGSGWWRGGRHQTFRFLWLTPILNQKWNHEMKLHFYFQNTFRGHLF
jgi:hypothetical protein